MDEYIRLRHGNGGRYARELTERYILPYFGNDALNPLHDGARLSVSEGHIAFTTDSYVVTPRFFPGGNIGSLAVCGTVNDLAMTGAVPEYLSCSFILEEGFPIAEWEDIIRTMAARAKEAGVSIVTGDTKVVGKGAADGIYINTAGIGRIPNGIESAPHRIRPGMKVILTGTLGDHAIAVTGTRYGMALSESLVSDCAPLCHAVRAVSDEVGGAVAVWRDPTRGGFATALCELAESGGVGILTEETDIPVRDEVRAVCDMLGYDPLYLANEGKAICIVEESVVTEILDILRKYAYTAEARVVGTVTASNAGKAALRTSVGGIRVLRPLGEDQVPRIC